MTSGLLGRDITVTAPDGRRLRAMASGTGDDLVVLEAGLGGSGLTWGLVHGILAPRSEPMVPLTDPDLVAATISALL
ncbi:hypothetical protein [Clavibacter sp. VKM Ac-2873]|uniref:hypothetical protein n=1 Tax=Clavibacter sp. VKM Ac-2873 TaxID=2783813 RepID=UPI001E505789|nr:hypothetical protein [Clavibacter sp. VKM Ac-2873]